MPKIAEKHTYDKTILINLTANVSNAVTRIKDYVKELSKDCHLCISSKGQYQISTLNIGGHCFQLSYTTSEYKEKKILKYLQQDSDIIWFSKGTQVQKSEQDQEPDAYDVLFGITTYEKQP